jgi:hypothetical protein
MPMEAAFETSPLCVAFIIVVERVAVPRASLTAKAVSVKSPGQGRVASRLRMTVDEILSAYQ